jgi:hypothetical protein
MTSSLPAARGRARALRALVVVEAPDPEQEILLVGAEGKSSTTWDLPITAATSSAAGACDA